MAFSNPIAGNQTFTSISYLSGQVPQLNVGDLSAASIDGQLSEYTVTGYAPTTFSTLGIAGVVNLNRLPGLPQAATTADPNLLRIPPRSVLNSVFATNNGTAITSGGAATLDIGLNAALTTTDDAGLNNSPIATINNGAAARGCSGGTPNTCLEGPGTSGAAAEQFIAVTANTAALTAGDLKVSLSFYVVPPVV